MELFNLDSMGLNFAFIRSLHKASPVAFGAMDLVEDNLIYSSGHAEKLLGYTKKELKELSHNYFASIIHPDDLKTSEEVIDKLRKSQVGEIMECTLRVRNAKGDYQHLFIRDIVFERNDEQTPVKFSSIVQDVTHLVELELNLREKVEAIQKISYKNSHELRAPVAKIIGLVDLLKTDSFKTEYNEKIFRLLEETVKKLDEVIHDINNLSN